MKRRTDRTSLPVREGAKPRCRAASFFRLPLFALGLVGSLAAAALAKPLANEPLSPLPPPPANLDPARVSLGKRLFSDTRLSGDNSVSCASCHDLDHGGMDGRVRSRGIHGAEAAVNAPTVFNSGLNFRQFWDGRAETLEEQVDGPVQNDKEMGSRWEDVIRKLAGDPEYARLFGEAFAGGVTRENVKSALADFERALVTTGSRFDRYLLGEQAALSENEKRGYGRFKSFGCVACHQGANVGGNMFQTMGVMGDYFRDRGTPATEADLGRYNVTNLESDKHVFRVPSLRNVALTAPYFHDGSARTLEAAVRTMGKYQLGRKLKPNEVADLVAFLKTLTGDRPAVLGDFSGEAR